ncbi:MAG: hypothetical protein M1551_00575 [Firmicutes bacterium]|nr:hypothetical protein [Bacillota bacterium]
MNIAEILGSEAASLLSYRCGTINKEQLHLPGPDYLERVYTQTSRPTPVLRSLALSEKAKEAILRVPGLRGRINEGGSCFAQNINYALLGYKRWASS